MDRLASTALTLSLTAFATSAQVLHATHLVQFPFCHFSSPLTAITPLSLLASSSLSSALSRSLFYPPLFCPVLAYVLLLFSHHRVLSHLCRLLFFSRSSVSLVLFSFFVCCRSHSSCSSCFFVFPEQVRTLFMVIHFTVANLVLSLPRFPTRGSSPDQC